MAVRTGVALSAVAAMVVLAFLRVVLVASGHDGDSSLTAAFTAMVGVSVAALASLHVGS